MMYMNWFNSLCNLILRLNYVEQASDPVCKSDQIAEPDVQKFRVSDSCFVSELPNSLIHEILLKLPINSIVQCRHVCKSWYRLISDLWFANVYFNNFECNGTVISQQVTYTIPKLACNSDGMFFDYIEIGRNGEITRTPLNLKAPGITKGKMDWKTIIGSCDGLLCVVETPCEKLVSLTHKIIYNVKDPNQTVWIINPLIGEYMVLPKVHVVKDITRVVYGFGSSVDGNHYKVVRIGMKYLTLVEEAHILSIGVDKEWRELDHASMPIRMYPPHGVTINGVLHWVGIGGHDHIPYGVIYAFDIGQETGHCFTLPCATMYEAFSIFLAVWDGNLCVIDNNNKLQIDIWTMKQYGVVESWSRDVIVKSSISRYELFPTTIINGDMLLLWPYQYSRALTPFNLKTKSYGEVFKLTDTPTSLLGSYAYAPSFFSPRDIITTTNYLLY